jgi:hypothetical protein
LGETYSGESNPKGKKGKKVTPKQQLEKKLSDNFHSYDYTYERFANGNSEFLVFPSDGISIRGWHQDTAQGAPMRYRFNREGERI